jgi:myo-inositol-1-phosphate synthase
LSTSNFTDYVGASIKPHRGKLGVMIPGMGAVATTLIAGVEAIRKGIAKPIGSISQMGTIRLGKRTDANSPLIKDFVDLCPLDDLVFTGWDTHLGLDYYGV